MNYSAKQLLKTFLRDVSQKNKVNFALENFIADEKPIDDLSKIREIPFSSDRKYGACVYDDFTLVLGAPEVLLNRSSNIFETVDLYTKQSYRVVVFGEIRGRMSKEPKDIKKEFKALSVLAIDDPVREETQSTLSQLTKEHIQYRIISGDSVDTVLAVAKKIDKDYQASSITGEELDKLHGIELEKAILEHNIFARIKPQQKQLIVRVLKKNNLFTIMIGDGVNDILALKESDLGIAMNAGSSMAKDVADVVLLNNSFATLPLLLSEGRRIITNIQTIANIYLIKNVSSIGTILLLGFIGLRFPFDPRHVELSSFLVIGIPSFVLAFEKHSFRSTDEGFIKKLLLFSCIVGFGNAIVYTTLYMYYDLTSSVLLYARSVLLTTIVFVGINNIFLIYLQHYSFDEIVKRKIVMGLVAGLFLLFFLCLSLPMIRNFFGIAPLTAIDVLISYIYGLIGSLTIKRILENLRLLKTKTLTEDE